MLRVGAMPPQFRMRWLLVGQQMSRAFYIELLVMAVFISKNLGTSSRLFIDGKLIASSSYDATVIIWDVESGNAIGPPLRGHFASVPSVTFSPDGKTVASAGRDGVVILWDVASLQPVGEPLPGHSSDVYFVTFSPDGLNLASSSCAEYDEGGWPCVLGEMILWDVNPLSWQAHACKLANRNLTLTEWAIYFPGEEYRITCPQWPVGN